MKIKILVMLAIIFLLTSLFSGRENETVAQQQVNPTVQISKEDAEKIIAEQLETELDKAEEITADRMLELQQERENQALLATATAVKAERDLSFCSRMQAIYTEAVTAKVGKGLALETTYRNKLKWVNSKYKEIKAKYEVIPDRGRDAELARIYLNDLEVLLTLVTAAKVGKIPASCQNPAVAVPTLVDAYLQGAF